MTTSTQQTISLFCHHPHIMRYPKIFLTLYIAAIQIDVNIVRQEPIPSPAPFPSPLNYLLLFLPLHLPAHFQSLILSCPLSHTIIFLFSLFPARFSPPPNHRSSKFGPLPRAMKYTYATCSTVLPPYFKKYYCWFKKH